MTVQLSPKRKDLGRSLSRRAFSAFSLMSALFPAGSLRTTVNGKATSRAAAIFSRTLSAAARSSSLSAQVRMLSAASSNRERTPSILVTNPSPGSPGLDRKTEFRNLDSPCHTPHHSNGKITGLLDPVLSIGLARPSSGMMVSVCR